MKRPLLRSGWVLGLTLLVALAGGFHPAHGGLMGLCQLIAGFDGAEMSYYSGYGPWGGGSVYVWGPPDYGLARYRSDRITQFGLDRSSWQNQVISDRLWDESQRSVDLARRQSRDYQQAWMRRMGATPPGWAVRPVPETRLERRGPIEPVTPGNVDWSDGRIQWPNLLSLTRFADMREEIDKEFQKFSKTDSASTSDRTQLLKSINSLREEFKGIGGQVGAHEYLISLRFLDRLEDQVYSR
jgi:hypothetical protein